MILFNAPYAEDDAFIAEKLLQSMHETPEAASWINRLALVLIKAVRDDVSAFDALLREYSLSSKEGLALMVMAEALLRIPDTHTANTLIEHTLGQMGEHQAASDRLFIHASVWALGLAAKIVSPDDRPSSLFATLASRLGMPVVRLALSHFMRFLGQHFVLGQTIDEALALSRDELYSYDMLGEGARTLKDARRYFDAYHLAITRIGNASENKANRPGISIKLSALHPTYSALNREPVIKELVPDVIELLRVARSFNVTLTLDAEEADRLELSLDVFAACVADGSFKDWDGFGLAVQAYQKRASAVIDYVHELGVLNKTRFNVRLVKGAYWDSEIKRAQERGLSDYPVFTRKTMTDLNYLHSASKLFSYQDYLFAQFATHNALSVASVLEMAGASRRFEFQRLHGMGDALYAALKQEHPDCLCRIYAPVGDHVDLLAYLVRRLLENGANSSFVAHMIDASIDEETLLRRPAFIIGSPDQARHPRIVLPRDLFKNRINSTGIEFGCRAEVSHLAAEIAEFSGHSFRFAPVIKGEILAGQDAHFTSSGGFGFSGDFAKEYHVNQAFAACSASCAFHPSLSDALDRAADLLQERSALFLYLLQAEAGKTLDDAVLELREAIDFCRYYAVQARLIHDMTLDGPTGESNVLRLRPRGIFVAISPWNFPLAIFFGQITAALVTGNSVIAKPAEQTPCIAFEGVKLLLAAGISPLTLHYLPGDGAIGAKLVAHSGVAGVVFTGSHEVARAINRTLAAKDGPIVPFIAETGGINAMIVDATALPEQVVDDVLASAFRSAGQRCSALRLLLLQDDVADRMIEMLVGAARLLKVGDAFELSSHIGPVIDHEAKDLLVSHINYMKSHAKHVHFEGGCDGFWVAPHIFELSQIKDLSREVFGPILHVVRYKRDELDQVVAALQALDYGLTLGIHCRIPTFADELAARLSIGNVYINRTMIGAVVGVQPFGGMGLSGTGPKAGGPYYLHRFMTEQTISTNLAAVGGNASLISLEE